MSKRVENKPLIKKFIINSTEPKMPNVELWMNANIVPPKGASRKLKPKREIIQVQQLSNAIFVKSEIAKGALSIIKALCSSSMRVTKEGGIGVKPELVVPVIKEVNCLIFELGSMLEFLSRQVDTVMSLGYGQESSLYKVTEKMKEDHSDDSLTILLQRFYDSAVQRYFRKMRNRITHRLPFDIRIAGAPRILFPDDPNSDDMYPSTDKKIEVITRCEIWINGILSFLDNVTGELMKQIGVTILEKE